MGEELNQTNFEVVVVAVEILKKYIKNWMKDKTELPSVNHLAANVVAVKQIYPSYQESGFEIETMNAEIKGFLRRYVTVGSLELRQTQKIGKLQQNLKDQFGCLVMTGRTLKSDVADERDFDELDEWAANKEEEVENTLNESEVFMEIREMMLLTEHEAGEDLFTDPAGIDVMLQVAEAATNTQIGVEETLKTYKTLTQVVEDAEEQAEPTFYPDDVSDLIMSAEESALCFVEPDDHLDEDRVMLGGTGQISDSHLK